MNGIYLHRNRNLVILEPRKNIIKTPIIPEGVLRVEEDELDVVFQVQCFQRLGQPAERPRRK